MGRLPSLDRASSPAGEDNFRAEVERDWNHPSIVIQSVMNEQWGMDPAQADQRAWLLNSFRDLKHLTAPLGRLITDNSACCSGLSPAIGFRRLSYVLLHSGPRRNLGRSGYRSTPPGRSGSIARMATQSPPARSRCWFLNSATGDYLNCRRAINCRGGSRATLKVVSLPAPPASSIVCIRYGLDRIYPDYGALALATERHEYLALKYEIEQMRQRNSIQGYVITELTDANWEANGLMSMWRQPKTFAGELGQLQQDDLVMANFATHNFTAGAAVDAPAHGVALFHRRSRRRDHPVADLRRTIRNVAIKQRHRARVRSQRKVLCTSKRRRWTQPRRSFSACS